MAAQALARAGFAHIRIYRHYPPANPGGDAEILFRAARREGAAARGPDRLYTAYLADTPGAEPIICDSW